ncbi:DUF58 domain-containing protein [Mucilaginibacter agri]|uniref:DUF58 domain-containing protein n=1 Tax=Mucilaginibacter agri TaxID=2695265 RepID=A0A965ZJJ1_9SPHI|nr:DUF58 domain-containing protein [Mucilaginibacter agri]NCD72318.1 DUF58 domain-containing protein [Mucilaginibacter agri]
MKTFFTKFYKNLFLNRRLFAGLAISSLLFLIGFFFPWFSIIPVVFFYALIILLILDLWVLYSLKQGIIATRQIADKLSNGDENEIGIVIKSLYTFKVDVGIIDEIPFQFQKRDVWFQTTLKHLQQQIIPYMLRPTKRGEYEFGNLLVYVSSPLGLLSRRYVFNESKVLPVYPAFLQMRKYELMAISNRLNEIGIKKIRRFGNSAEFEQIKNYVPGDDYRTINWKATARKGEFMVNSYIEEKSQHVYCVIDKSRVMKMPFEGLSLLDYAINSSLVLSSVALFKEDKAGLITISDKKGAVIPADNRPTHLNKIMEVLYREKTRYLETNTELLYNTIRHTLKQRSLVVYFTNIESLSALKRQLPFLKQISKFHLLLVVFFENTSLKTLSETPAKDVASIYTKTIAEKFVYEKKQIVKELNNHGIQSILTSPQNLTVNTINTYFQIKAAQKI